MSIDALMSTIERIQRELEVLHRQLADESAKEAQRTERINRLAEEAGRSTSLHTIESKRREMSRLSSEVASTQKKRADITGRIARKTKDLYQYQQDLTKEQSREQANLLRALRQQADSVQRLQERPLRPLARRVAQSEGRMSTAPEFDFFICHASEDKEDFVRGLAEGLISRGLRVWYDDFQLAVGDSLRRSIDKGLARSRFGIVILSPSFFAKNWPQYELDGLVAKEMSGGKVVLPIWHHVSKDDVLRYSPSLADRVALSTGVLSTPEIVERLAKVLLNTHA